MTWSFHFLHPQDMMEEGAIHVREFESRILKGSIAGSVGKKINHRRKPGIQEDGGLVALSDQLEVYLLIDAHYEMDITKIMLSVLEEEIDTGLWDNVKWEDPMILQRCLAYSEHVRQKLGQEHAVGEASFTLLLVSPPNLQMRYFSVGDLILFVDDPNRSWGSAFQVSGRHFYEWINAIRLMGYHFGAVPISPGSRVLLATDGLIDQVTMSLAEIGLYFDLHPFTAFKLVDHALITVPDDEDDNIAILCLSFQ